MSNNRPSPERLGEASFDDACDLLFGYGPRGIFSMLRAACPPRDGMFIADVIEEVGRWRRERVEIAGALPTPRTEPELLMEVPTDKGNGQVQWVETIPRQFDGPILDARQRQLPNGDRD